MGWALRETHHPRKLQLMGFASLILVLINVVSLAILAVMIL
jgi:hypothetical protein